MQVAERYNMLAVLLVSPIMTMSKGRILHTGQFGSLLTHWFERTLPTLIIPKNVYCGVMTSSAKPGPPIAW